MYIQLLQRYFVLDINVSYFRLFIDLPRSLSYFLEIMVPVYFIVICIFYGSETIINVCSVLYYKLTS